MYPEPVVRERRKCESTGSAHAAYKRFPSRPPALPVIQVRRRSITGQEQVITLTVWPSLVLCGEGDAEDGPSPIGSATAFHPYRAVMSLDDLL